MQEFFASHVVFLNGGGNLINRNKVMKLGIKPERIRALCAIVEIQDKDFEEELEKLRLRYCPGNSA